MQRLKLAAAILCLTGSLAFGRDLAGNYDAKGTSADGKTYTAVVDIVVKEQSYIVTWHLANDVVYSGIGILSDGVFSVGWITKGAPAVAAYKVDGDRLEGKWSETGGGMIFTETLTRR